MKKSILMLFTVVGMLFFTACNNEPKPVPVTFDITASEITAGSALVTVTPSDTNVLYYFDLFSAENFAGYETPMTAAEDLLEYVKEGVAEYQEYGYDVELVDWLSQGQDSYRFSGLSAETEYVVVAFCVDTATEAIVGSVYHNSFTTPQVEEVELMFEAAISDTAIWFLPNSDEIEYFAMYVDTDTLQSYGFTAAEYFEYLVNYYGEYIEYFLMNGPIYVELSELIPGSTYVFAARAYAAGVWNSPLFTANFTAPVENTPSEIAPPRTKMQFNRALLKKNAKRVFRK